MTNIYYHVTPSKNADSIRDLGILSNYSRSKHGAMFFVTAKKLAWAIRHVVKRHHLPVTDVTVFQVCLDNRHTYPFHRHVVYRFINVYPNMIISSFNVKEVKE